MNILDVIMAVIVGFCLVRGLFRGLIKEITSIVGVFVGFYVAFYHYQVAAHVLSRVIGDKAYLNILSIIITFTLLFLAVGFVGILLKHLLKALDLGPADRVLGGGFGLVKAILIVAILLIPLTTFLPKDASLVKDSFFAPYVTTISEKIILAVPKEIKGRFAENLKVLKDSWKKQ